MSEKDDKNAVSQGKSKVGYGNPPDEYKFKPGKSGNPKGSPKRRTQLWVWFCKYANMTDKQLEKLDKSKLKQVQQSALKLVRDMKDGKYSGSTRLARYVIDREEGKTAEHIIFGNDNTLTDEECEQIRKALLKNHAN